MKQRLNQRKEADKTRTAILKAATKLFAEKGYSGTPTAAIAKAATKPSYKKPADSTSVATPAHTEISTP